MSHLVASKQLAFGGNAALGRGLFSCVCILAIVAFRPQVLAGPLTNAADVLSLSAEEALKGLPVRVRGVVTVAEPLWGGQFFIQDQTSGVFVENVSTNRPEVGDVLELIG